MKKSENSTPTKEPNDLKGLYVVATPIGNLEDITLRAIRILTEVDVIAAEDTRNTGKLLKRLGIETPMLGYHDHNEKRFAPQLVERMQQGESIALVSDAGTPLISDPGYRLVNAAIDAEVPITGIPGPCAAINALSISGLAVHEFAFRGFLPKKSGQMARALAAGIEDEGSTIFYESPHRLKKTLGILLENHPDVKLCVGREMTKMFEENMRGTAAQILEIIGERTVKGEITIILEG